MKTFNYTITDPIGIHARPAGLLAKAAKASGSKVTISANGKSADASKLILLMGLGIKCGTEVTVSVEGGDEAKAADDMEQFFKSNL